MPKELKPCPFCGSRDISKKTELADCTIWCNDCGVRISRWLYCGKYDCLADAEEDLGTKAVMAWNRRVDNAEE